MNSMIHIHAVAVVVLQLVLQNVEGRGSQQDFVSSFMCEQLFEAPHVESGSPFASGHTSVVRSQPDADGDHFVFFIPR